MSVREKVAKEFVETEQTYCNTLQSIISDFKTPAEIILKPQSIKHIFSNLTQFADIHFLILPDLQKCLETWTERSCIASVFEILVPYLKLYRTYCFDYNRAIQCVEEQRRYSSKFAALLIQNRDERNFDLASLLIQPIQRIPRYRMLFEELLKTTPADHPDYQKTSDTLESIREVAILVNESIRAKENQAKLVQIQQSLTGSKIPPIVAEDRLFMFQGTLTKICRKEQKARSFFLFSDLLIYCASNEKKTAHTFRRAISLDKVRVDDQPDTTELQNGFHILSNQKSFTVLAATPQLKEKWIEEINRAIQLCFQQNTGNSPNQIAPVWIPDKEQKMCMACKAKFTTLFRRHHCRKCGTLVCGDCSSKKFKLDNIGKMCRVCDKCYLQLTFAGKFVKWDTSGRLGVEDPSKNHED